MSTETIEEWRPVVGFEGKYEVSNFGRVKSLNYRGNMNICKVLRPFIHKNNYGYMKYTLVNKDKKVKTVLVHWLVMAAFVGVSNGRYIDHIDGDGSNNRLSNLRYCTHRENLTFSNVRHKKKRASEHPGVHYNKNSNGTNKWRSIIQVNKKKISIGTFATETEAAEAYLSKLKEISNYELVNS